MQIRVCNRCRCEVLEVPEAQAAASVTIPAELPAGAPVLPIPGPVEVALAVTPRPPADLCAACRRAALVEYIGQEIASSGAPRPDVKALRDRFVAIIKAAL